MPRIALLAALLAAVFVCPVRGDDEESFADQLNAAASRASGEKFTLEYKFAQGDEIRYEVTHLVTVDTTIEGVRQRARSRSVSTKVWEFSELDGEDFVFTYSVADVDMWQKVDRREEVRYNSRSDEKPPAQYEKVADTVGLPLAEITIDKHGKVVQRMKITIDSKGKITKTEDAASLGGWGGGLIVPLPLEPVAIGAKWHKPQEINLRLQDGRFKKLKTRQQYELKSVEEDQATISVVTQILTPINDPKVKAQIVQRLTKGEIVFDIGMGRIASQQLELDETVIGFNGPKSQMAYAGRFSEKLLEEAAKPPLRSAAKDDEDETK